jgi:hypothetical protein
LSGKIGEALLKKGKIFLPRVKVYGEYRDNGFKKKEKIFLPYLTILVGVFPYIVS